MRLSHTTFVQCAVALVMAIATPGAAQNVTSADGGEKQGWQIDIGGGLLAYPRFPGASQTHVQPIPEIEVHYRDRFFASQREGIGYNLLPTGPLKVGPVINFAFPRNESDQRAALSGLGNIAFTVEAGGFLRYDFGRYAQTRLEVRQGANGHKGAVVDAGLDLSAPPLLNDRLFLTVGPRASFYDHAYAQAYFGVTQTQSTASGYGTFAPGSGASYGVGGAAVLSITRRLSLTAFGDYRRLAGDIANAPLVIGRFGSRDQFTVGAALAWRFNVGG